MFQLCRKVIIGEFVKNIGRRKQNRVHWEKKIQKNTLYRYERRDWKFAQLPAGSVWHHIVYRGVHSFSLSLSLFLVLYLHVIAKSYRIVYSKCSPSVVYLSAVYSVLHGVDLEATTLFIGGTRITTGARSKLGAKPGTTCRPVHQNHHRYPYDLLVGR